MAEEEPKREKPEGGFIRRYVRNPLATAANKILPVRLAKYKYKKTKVYTPEIRLRPLYRILASRLEKLRTLESRWDNVEKLKARITKIYMDIGQYYSDDCIKQERLTVRYGNYVKGHATTMSDVVTEDERKIKILGKWYKVPSPRPMYVYFPDGEMHKLQVYGFHKRGEWEEVYSKFLKDVCDDIIKRYKEKEIGNEESEEEVERTLSFVRGAFKDKIKYIFDFVIEELGVPHYARIWGGVGAEEKPAAGACGARIQELQQMESEIISTRPYTTKMGERSDIKYDHAYKIIKPIPTDEEIKKWSKYIEKAEELRARDDVTPNEVYERAVKRARRRIKGLEDLKKSMINEIRKLGFEKRAEEVDWGLDENGMPLEVDEHGNVLIDRWKGRFVRKVPTEFITNCDFLDIICYIHNEWDSYRDDLRDARYHPNSLTAVDYVMAANPKKGFWGARKERNMEKGYSKYTMKLRRNWLGFNEIRGERRPDNLSPAFDHRAGDQWRHVGRKYYYDPVDYVEKGEVKEGVMSSRGISNYILWRVVFMGGGMKIFGEAREAIRKIKEEMKQVGFDAGPRMVGWSFNPDPFNIKTIDELNKGLPPEARE